jgi:hypothetical protein
MREYLSQAENLYREWRRWQLIWRWSNTAIAGTSVALGALVAANVKSNFLPSEWAILAAVLAPILTFLLTSLKPQANAAAFEVASRELEKAINQYSADVTKEDPFLGDAISRGIDLLNRVGAS